MEGTQGSLVSQPSLLCELQASGNPCPKSRVDSSWWMALKVVLLPLHACTHTCTHPTPTPAHMKSQEENKTHRTWWASEHSRICELPVLVIQAVTVAMDRRTLTCWAGGFLQGETGRCFPEFSHILGWVFRWWSCLRVTYASLSSPVNLLSQPWMGSSLLCHQCPVWSVDVSPGEVTQSLNLFSAQQPGKPYENASQVVLLLKSTSILSLLLSDFMWPPLSDGCSQIHYSTHTRTHTELTSASGSSCKLFPFLEGCPLMPTCC